MAAVGGRSFSWLRGRREVYPLLATLGLGVGLVAYISGRHFYTNPEVHVSKSHRISGPLDDEGKTEMRAKGYASSIFRQTGEGKRKTIF